MDNVTSAFARVSVKEETEYLATSRTFDSTTAVIRTMGSTTAASKREPRQKTTKVAKSLGIPCNHVCIECGETFYTQRGFQVHYSFHTNMDNKKFSLSNRYKYYKVLSY